MTARAILIGAPRSGTGKTSLTIALLRAFARRGLRVRGVKTGPDYIDPAFHRVATGRDSLNLDSWAMAPALLDAMMAEAAADADLLIVESAMGLFDGIAGMPGRTGAPADVARRFALPVLLVLDISGQSQTVAAVARGFVGFDPEVPIAGVVLNRAGSARHVGFCGAALEHAGIAVFGALRRDPALALPERHLGLVQASELADLDMRIDRLADAVEAACDLDALLATARPPRLATADARLLPPPPGHRIALARDDAFRFIYPHLLDHWRRSGAAILPFSPLADEPPPPDCDACWLPGGYPELHAGRLAAADRFMTGLRSFAEHRPINGECGGYMVLGRALVDAEGRSHPMAGLLSHVTSFARRRLHLGYRRARLRTAGPSGDCGMVLNGHEFHYATVSDPGHDAPLADLEDGEGRPLGPAGGRRGQVTGTFFHVIAIAAPAADDDPSRNHGGTP